MEKCRNHGHKPPPSSQTQTRWDLAGSLLLCTAVDPPVAGTLNPGTRNHPLPHRVRHQIEGSLSRSGILSTSKTNSSTLTGMQQPEQPLLGRHPSEGEGDGS